MTLLIIKNPAKHPLFPNAAARATK
jgi:hypothetical protein